MDNRPVKLFTVTAAAVATGLLAYAVYFDYKRRNDAQFRKKLRKEKKRVNKTVAEQAKENPSASASSEITPEVLRNALQQIKNEPSPATSDEKEAYFMTQVGMGEQLAAQGPAFRLPAAMAFFRALRVYPSPVELIVIYQKTVPEEIFNIVMDMTNLDVKARIEAYYDEFPPKSTNVAVETRETHPNQGPRKVLIVKKGIPAGEVIYKEFPIVAALDQDLQLSGTHCTHCLRLIQSNMAIQIPEDSCVFPSTYCSKACLLSSKAQSNSLLFTLDPALPPEIPAPPSPPALMENRKKAQVQFVNHLKKEGRAAPVLAARFIARQVVAETNKMIEATGKRPAKDENDFTDSDSKEYGLADHIERLRYLEVVPADGEHHFLVDVLQATLPGLEQFVTDERYATLLGKLAYNAFGVCFGGGRDDRPQQDVRPENVEKSRTPYGTDRQIGSALYTVSSYLNHSCRPSARPSFSSGTSELHLIATRDLKEGDELTVAYVDVTQRPDETIVDCRRRRRMELVRGWRFACLCERCAEEGKDMSSEEKGGDVAEEPKDDSKVEKSARHEDPVGLAVGGVE